MCHQKKVFTFLKRMVRSWTSFSAVSITGWFFGRPPERDLQLHIISGEVFSLFLKMFTWNHVHVLECVHYTYTCTCTCLYTCTWSLQHAWNIRQLKNVSDKIMFTAFLKNKGNVRIRTFGFKLNQVMKFKPYTCYIKFIHYCMFYHLKKILWTNTIYLIVKNMCKYI